MAKITHIGVASAAKIGAIIYAALGLIYGAFIALVMLLGASLGGNGAGFGGIMALVMLVAMPIIFAVMGAIGVGLTAFIYNIAAGYVGGIEVQVKK